jgi:hypothetical protein
MPKGFLTETPDGRGSEGHPEFAELYGAREMATALSPFPPVPLSTRSCHRFWHFDFMYTRYLVVGGRRRLGRSDWVLREHNGENTTMISFLRPRSTTTLIRRRGVRQPTVELLEGRTLLAASALPDIAMISATTPDSQSITFTFQVENASLNAPFDVAFYRAPASHFDLSADVEIGAQMVSASDLSVGSHTETAAIPGGLPIDPAHPYVLAVANPTGGVVESDAAHDTNDTASFRTFLIGAVSHGFELTPGLPAWVPIMANSLKQDGYDATIAFDWSASSKIPAPGLAVAAGGRLADQVAAAVAQLVPQMGPGDVVDLHLIGHSRGAVVISQAGLDLEAMEQGGQLPQLKAGSLKMTFLAPHPAHNVHIFGNPTQAWYSASPGPIGQFARALYIQFSAQARDPEVIVPNNAADAEVYYQHTPYTQAASLSEKFFNNWDEVPVLGENGTPLLGGMVHYCDLTGIANGHYEVHDWYQQNVVRQLRTSTAFVCPGNSTPPTQPPSPTPSGKGFGSEVAALWPSVFIRRRAAFAFEDQLSGVESALMRGHNRAALSRLGGLERFLRAQTRRGGLTPGAADFLNTQLQPFLGAFQPVLGPSLGGSQSHT